MLLKSLAFIYQYAAILSWVILITLGFFALLLLFYKFKPQFKNVKLLQSLTSFVMVLSIVQIILYFVSVYLSSKYFSVSFLQTITQNPMLIVNRVAIPYLVIRLSMKLRARLN